MKKLSTVLFLLGIVLLVVQGFFLKPKSEIIAKSTFPKYKSANQDLYNGWVQLSAVELDEIATGQYHSKTTFNKGSSLTQNDYTTFYLAKDDAGNRFVYADKYDNPYTYMNLKRWGFPQKLYGRLTDLKSAYSTYDGYDEALAQYEQYDLIIGLRYPAEASMIVQTETQKTLEPIFLYGGIICLILGVILGKIRR